MRINQLVCLASVLLLSSGYAVQPVSEPATGPRRIAIVPIDGGEQLDDVTTEALQRRCEQAVDDGADVIVIELDTPGGMVSSSSEMSDYLAELSQDRGIRTVAWVHDEAISGGTMVALGCDEIVMSRNSRLGDCGVILVGPDGASTAQDDALDAKIDSYVLAVFRNAANRRGYDPLLCESFVRHEYELWMIEHVTTGERRFIKTEIKKDMLEPEDGEPQWRLVETFVDPLDGQTKAMRQPIVADDELLTMTQSEAVAVGFATALVSNETELREHLGAQTTTVIERYATNWSEALVKWLVSPMIRSVLFALVAIGAYAEFKAPGLGVPGVIAAVALLTLLGAPYLTGLANIWEMLIVVLGLALIALEIFVIPGFGIAGLAGLVLVIAGLLGTYMPEDPRLPSFGWPTMDVSIAALERGIHSLALGAAGAVLGMIGLSRYLHTIPFARDLVAPNPTAAEVTVDDPYHGQAHVGDVGTTESPLRPAGKARFGSLLVDVVTEGEMIEPHAAVEVIARRGNHIVVRKADSA